MNFTEKVVIVTGSSSGIGAATAIHFAQEGANVIIIGRNEDKLNKVFEKCKQYGNETLAIKADVTNDEDIKNIVKQTVDKFGKINILVNNAAIGGEHSHILDGDMLLQSYDEIMAVNVRSVVQLTSLVAPYLVKTKGNIVNVSSIAGIRIINHSIPYCLSKAALDHFTRITASQLGEHGVRVNSVNPGPVNTDMLQTVATKYNTKVDDYEKFTVLGRITKPVEIAELIAFLASDKSRGITGSSFVSDNGALLKGCMS